MTGGFIVNIIVVAMDADDPNRVQNCEAGAKTGEFFK